MSEQDHDLGTDAEPNDDEELEQDGELLPRREVMSILDLGESGPVHTLPVEPPN